MRFSILAALTLVCFAPAAWAQEAESPHARWEKAIAEFEKRDAEKMPPKDGIVFVGSSSIVGWKLDESFPDLPIIKRGFGGSQLDDSVHFAPRIVTKYEPKIVVLYAGDNDLASGKTPEKVASDFDAFVRLVHEKLPKTKIIYVAVKPSIARWKLIDKVRETNRLIAEKCKKDERLVFLDIQPLMLGDDGQPKPELFVKDGLHLSAEGYRRWSDLLRPHLKLEK